MSDTGQRIKKLRKELNITADELAQELNVSRSTIFRYENGDIEKVPATIIEPLALALHTTPAYLMGWDDDPTDYDRVDDKDAKEVPVTTAAHLDIADLTQAEIDEVDNFIAYVRNKRKQ
ncbi:MAG: helix-turn-helix domain-containing protein [Lachnospiraceae bacterium]